ncbi:hypothetical protein PG987_016375 [Apiospora arundinis]
MALSIFNQFHKHPDTKAIQAAGTHPQSIEYALRVYDHACRLMPADLKSNYNNCTGEEAARKNLGMFFVYMVRPINPFREPDEVGESLVSRDWDYDGPEYANVVGADDVQLGKVIEKLNGNHELRHQTVIQWTVVGRAQALGVIQTGKGGRAHLPQHFVGLLRPSVMGHGYMWPWSKADFVGACVGMRGAAKTHLDEVWGEKREEVLKTWKEGVAEFLLERDQAVDNEDRKFHNGEFHIKYHAAGPRDETSEELFSTVHWFL